MHLLAVGVNLGHALAFIQQQRRSTMKLFLPLSVLVLLGIFTPNMFADPVLTITDGVGAGAFVETPIAGGETWVYTDDSTTILGLGVLQTDNDVLSATFTDVAGVALLNVTDVCANIGVLAPANPCAGFAFSDTSLGIPYVISATGDLAAAVDLNAGALGIDLAGLSVGNGTASIGFNNPPPSVTPEPSALTLLGTGLLGLAGAVKRKYYA
jgi:hypothetical protein